MRLGRENRWPVIGRENGLTSVKFGQPRHMGSMIGPDHTPLKSRADKNRMYCLSGKIKSYKAVSRRGFPRVQDI